MSGKRIIDTGNIFKEKDKGQYVPFRVAEQTMSRDLEDEVFKISFREYLYKKCELNDVHKSCHIKMLKWFKALGQCKTTNDLKDTAGLDYITPISSKSGKSSKYSKLSNFVSNRVSPDVDILHQELGGTARMFYFISTSDKVLNVLLVSNKHWK